jgi:hypothetical protein
MEPRAPNLPDLSHARLHLTQNLGWPPWPAIAVLAISSANFSLVFNSFAVKN